MAIEIPLAEGAQAQAQGSSEVAALLDELKKEVKAEEEKPTEEVEKELEKELEEIEITEDECEALIAVIYTIPPVLWKVPDYKFSEAAIKMRGRQLAIIMKRYHITIKYLDLLFFGAGVFTDISACYMYAREQRKKEKGEEAKE